MKRKVALGFRMWDLERNLGPGAHIGSSENRGHTAARNNLLQSVMV
jgi:hypothetical protein